MPSAVFIQDEEDQAYLMDDAGNIELSQTDQTLQRTVDSEKTPNTWGNELDDQEYLDSLNDFEKRGGEISDQLLLSCMADFDSQEKG